MEQSSRVSIVDDERVIATTLALIFRQAGFAAESFFNPMALLQASEQHSPAVVISDVVMPGMTGVELALRLGVLHPACTVILISGQAETSELLRDAAQHGHDFAVLAKPVHPATLLARVRAALRGDGENPAG